MVNLPIDVVPGSRPPSFRWRQTVETPYGCRVVEHVGSLPPTVEEAVKLLISVAKQLHRENEVLKRGRNDVVEPEPGGSGAGGDVHLQRS